MEISFPKYREVVSICSVLRLLNSTNTDSLSTELKGDLERANLNQDPNYCGSCYGAPPPESGYVVNVVMVILCKLNNVP